jgi:hypothetical protein
MRRSFTVIALALVMMSAAFGAGVAADKVVMNRAWWNDTIPEGARVYIIEGSTDAYQSGWLAGSTAEGVRVLNEAREVLPATALDEVHTIVYRKEQSGEYASFDALPTFSKTFGEYEKEISGFYTTYPNAGDAEFGEILGCLSDNPQITCSDLAKQQ